MMLYKIISVLLMYPSEELVEAVAPIRQALRAQPLFAVPLEPLLLSLEASELIELQERYVKTFDRNPACSLHLFEHIYGEDRARGQAMVDLLEEYQQQGLHPVKGELPDYLPLFLEYLAMQQEGDAKPLLIEAISIVAHIGKQLRKVHSVYAGLLEALVLYSGVEPVPLTVPPIKDMDEMLEKFGPEKDGVEPLLQPASPVISPIHFYRTSR